MAFLSAHTQSFLLPPSAQLGASLISISLVLLESPRTTLTSMANKKNTKKDHLARPRIQRSLRTAQLSPHIDVGQIDGNAEVVNATIPDQGNYLS